MEKENEAAPGAREPVRIDDTELQCPSACYTISRAVCNERQKRNYHECPICEWSKANVERRNVQQELAKIHKRYDF